MVYIDLLESNDQVAVSQSPLRVFEDDPENSLSVERIVGGSIEPTTGELILSLYTPCCGSSGSHRLVSFFLDQEDNWQQQNYLGTISDGSLRQSHFQYYPSSQSFHIRLKDTVGDSNKAFVFPNQIATPDSFQRSVDISESNKISTAFRPLDKSFYIAEAITTSEDSDAIVSLDEIAFYKLSEDGTKTNLPKCHAPSVTIEDMNRNFFDIVDHVYLESLDLIVGKSGIAYSPATNTVSKLF